MGTKTVPNIFNDSLDNSIHCPRCSNEYVHFDEPRLFKGHDNYAANFYGWKGRGSLIVIPLWCESCCSPEVDHDNKKFFLCLGFHKGNTAIWIYTPDKEEHNLYNPNHKFSER